MASYSPIPAIVGILGALLCIAGIWLEFFDSELGLVLLVAGARVLIFGTPSPRRKGASTKPTKK